MGNLVVDTNPLSYIYNAVPELGEKYASLLGELGRKNKLLIPKLVYAELSLIFKDTEELNNFIHDTGIAVGDLALDTYVTAAKRWSVYNRRRTLMCQHCGAKLRRFTCRACGAEIR
ncbi:MAG: hypothetical protein JRI36_11765, partial [Deltaproteobacteria bacterium]|nr:hypothetical protein [Deltaproteobacteria bacterium]